MEYKLILEVESRDFEAKVNLYLKHGWQLHGTLKYSRETLDMHNIYVQAVTRGSYK